VKLTFDATTGRVTSFEGDAGTDDLVRVSRDTDHDGRAEVDEVFIDAGADQKPAP
jgi:hypothetical protein